jgi:hypothetical protein
MWLGRAPGMLKSRPYSAADAAGDIMDTIDQQVSAFNAELGKAKEQFASNATKARSAVTDQIATLRKKADASRREAGAKAHAGLDKFENDLKAFEAKVNAKAEDVTHSKH